jgi:riboflavin kinase/FMN adenylyltransferase
MASQRNECGAETDVCDAVEPSVETFVMNWDGDLYGDVVRVRFLYRLRDERKFNSVEELKKQIARDVDRANSYFERAGTKHMLSVI